MESADRDDIGALAVFDLGKTNSKLFVYAPDGSVLAQRRSKPLWIEYHGRQVLDDAHLLDWMRTELANMADMHNVTNVTVSGHGCTFALVRGDSCLTHPVLDYEQEIPDHIAAQIDPLLLDFEETFTPALPLGFAIARHIYWLEQVDPTAFEAAEAILCYPQFWCWRLGASKVSECSYLGCHTHLWAPLKHDFSTVAQRLGWREKLPALMRAGTVTGSTDVTLADGSTRSIAIHNGVHDSNAALSYYRMTGLSDFTIVSTGTWVIVINPDCPLSALDRDRDMLANTTIDMEPAATARFMGGREFDLISGGWSDPIGKEAVERVIKRGVFALPSWAAGGPFPGAEGTIVGSVDAGEERAAVAALYVLMMTDLLLDLTMSANTIVVDGGLARIGTFTSGLAQLRPGQTVLKSSMSEGSATGAAAIAFDTLGLRPFRDETIAVASAELTGLAQYRERWRAAAEALNSAKSKQVVNCR